MDRLVIDGWGNFIGTDHEQIKRLIDSEKMPHVSKGNQCGYCEMKKFCT